MHASPFYWMRLPADFAWATFILAYLHGIDIQAKHSHPFMKKGKIELLWKRVVSWLLVFCSIWYSMLEAAGVIYSLRPKQGFFVIHKPSLAAENKIDTSRMQSFQQSWNTIPTERKVWKSVRIVSISFLSSWWYWGYFFKGYFSVGTYLSYISCLFIRMQHHCQFNNTKQ